MADTTGIGPAEPVRAGLIRIGAAQFDRIATGLSGSPDRDTGVHESRKALKRLRALLRIARPHLSKEGFARHDSVLRDLGRLLAPLRDSWVSIVTLDRVAEGSCPVLRDRLVGAHDAAVAEVEADPAILGGLSSTAAAAAAAWPAAVPEALEGFQGMEAGIGRTYSRGRKRMHRAERDRGDDDFHRWRREVKFLRYQLEALAPAAGVSVGDQIVVFDELGETLGDEHDMTVLLGLVESGDDCGGERSTLVDSIMSLRAELRSRVLAVGVPAYRLEKAAAVAQWRSHWAAGRVGQLDGGQG